jgi:hypothetical protein
MQTFVSCFMAIFIVAGAPFTDRAEADLIRLINGGEIRCTTIRKEKTVVKCGSVAGDMSFPETMIKEIVHDNSVGYAAGSASVSEARTYGPGSTGQSSSRGGCGRR